MARSKGWSKAARSSARRMSGLLKEMAKSPWTRLKARFGDWPIGPEAIIAKLKAAKNRGDLNDTFALVRHYKGILEQQDPTTWPKSDRGRMWTKVRACYRRMHAGLPGRERLLGPKGE